MKYLLSYIILVGIGIGGDLFRLIIANILRFDIKKFSVFKGTKLIEITNSNFTFELCMIPYGSYVEFDESYIERGRISKLLVSFLPEVLLLVVAYIFITRMNSNVLFISGILVFVTNGLGVLLRGVLDTAHVFYRHKNDEELRL